MAAPTDLTDNALASLAHQMVTGAVLGDFAENPEIEEVYWRHTDALLALAPWTFTIWTGRLSRYADAPASKWDYRFAQPSDRLDLPFSYYDSKDADYPFGEWEVFEDELHTDADTVYATYARRPSSPRQWGPLFAEFAKTSLAAEIALHYEDAAKYERFKAHAWGAIAPREPGGLWLRALERHGASLPVLEMQPSGGPLLGALFGGV